MTPEEKLQIAFKALDKADQSIVHLGDIILKLQHCSVPQKLANEVQELTTTSIASITAYQTLKDLLK